MASLAQATGSLIDSGCKHIIPVRASFDFFTKFCNIPQENMLRNKMKYSIHKGDIVLCVGTNMFEEGAGEYSTNEAYPPVTTTMCINDNDIDEEAQAAIASFYNVNEVQYCAQTYPELRGVAKGDEKVAHMLRCPDFRFMGFSLGLGYAHPTSGDTVVSSMIGGLITVTNGPFPIRTGDKIQWCFFFEAPFFDESGRRLGPNADPDTENALIPPPIHKDRMTRALKQNGVYDLEALQKKRKTRSDGKIPLAIIKPFFDSLHPQFNYPLDRARLIGKALSNARPYDKVDLMVGTQH